MTEGTETTATTPPATPPPPTVGTTGFTQDQVNDLVGRARQEARAVREAEVLKSLGVESLDEATAAIKAKADADAMALSELERERKAREAAETNLVRMSTERDQALVTANISGALRDAGIKPERIEAAMRVMDRSAISVADGQVTGVKDVVDKLVAEFPEWKSTTATGGAPDLSGRGEQTTKVDYSDADPATVARALREYGVRV